MMHQNTKAFKDLLVWGRILKWLDKALFVFYLIGLLSLVTLNWYCNSTSCIVSTNEIQFGVLIMLAFVFGGIINSVRIGIVYLIHDSDPKPERLFFLSLFLMTVSYVIIGYYFNSDINTIIEYSKNSFLYTILSICVILSTIIVLADKQTWHKNSLFVQIRTSLTIFNLVILYFSPVLGFFTSILVIPYLLLLNDESPGNTPQRKK